MTLTLKPAPPNSGIIFRRVDMDPVVEIPAYCRYVGDTRLSTTLVNGNAKVSTVEHLIAAFGGLAIDNAYVEVDDDEVPIMDGSASPFVFLLQSAGIKEQDASKSFVRIKKTVRVEKDGKWAMFEPHDGFKVTVTIKFDHPLFTAENSTAEVDFSKTSFVQGVSRARTFGFLRDVEYLRQQNLALGGDLGNAIVIDDKNLLNEEQLRSEDECVRHKVLDAIGDLYLLGHNLIGAFSAFRSGHEINNILLKKLLKDKSAWEEMQYENDYDIPIRLAPLVSTYNEMRSA